MPLQIQTQGTKDFSSIFRKAGKKILAHQDTKRITSLRKAVLQKSLKASMDASQLTPLEFKNNDYNIDSDSNDEEKEFWDNKTLKAFKQHYTETYGIQLKIPAHYVLQAKFYPGDLRYKIVIANYVLPEDDEHDFEVIFHKNDEDYKFEYPELNFFSEYVEEEIYEKLHLKLLKFEDGVIRCVKEQPLDANRNAQFTFSKNGDYLAIYLTEKFLLKIFKISDQDIESAFESFEEEPYYELDVKSYFQVDRDVANAPSCIKFGTQNETFAIFGQQKACIICLLDKSISLYTNDKRLFSQILDV